MKPVFAAAFTVTEWTVAPPGTSPQQLFSDPNFLESSSSTPGTVFAGLSGQVIHANGWADAASLGFYYTQLNVSCLKIGDSGVWPGMDILLTGNCILQVSDSSGRIYAAHGPAVRDSSDTCTLVPMPDGNGYALNTLPSGTLAAVRVKFSNVDAFVTDTSAGVAPTTFSVFGNIQAAIAYKKAPIPELMFPIATPKYTYAPAPQNFKAASVVPNAYSIVEWMVLEAPQHFIPQIGTTRGYLGYTGPSAAPLFMLSTVNADSLGDSIFSSEIMWDDIRNGSLFSHAPVNSCVSEISAPSLNACNVPRSGPSSAKKSPAVKNNDKLLYFDVFLSVDPNCNLNGKEDGFGAFNVSIMGGPVPSGKITGGYNVQGGYTQQPLIGYCPTNVLSSHQNISEGYCFGNAYLPVQSPLPPKDVSGKYSLMLDATTSGTIMIYPGFSATNLPSNALVVLRLAMDITLFTKPSVGCALVAPFSLFTVQKNYDPYKPKPGVVGNLLPYNGVQGIMAYATSVVPAASLASTYISPSPLAVTPPAPLSLTAASQPYAPLVTGGSGKALTWTSADSDIVAVSPSTGLLTPGPNAAGGTTTVTVTDSGGASGAAIAPLTFAATVLPAVPLVTAIAFSQAAINLRTGAAPVTLVPTLTPAAAAAVPLAWSSTNIAVATVTQAGVVTPITEGSAIISAVACDGSNTAGTVPVTVTTSVSSIAISQTSISATKSGAIATPLVATVSPATASNPGITWSSSNWMLVASVDASTGVVTIIGNGTANIIATAADGSGVTASIPVNVALAVQSIAITPAGPLQATVAGQVMQLSAALKPPAALVPGVSWLSSNPAAATVDASTGLVTIISNGAASITATALDGKGASASIAVTVAIPEIRITPESSQIVLQTGQATLPGLKTSPAGTPPVAVTWSIDTPAVATVDPASGTLTAVAPGLAVLTATAVSERDQKTNALLSATFNIGVQAQPVLVSSVNIATTADGATVVVAPENTLQLAQQSTMQLASVLLPATAFNKACTWSSSSPDIVAVAAQQDGATATLTALKPGGPVAIYAATNDGTGLTATANITVTQAPTGISLNSAAVALKGIGVTGAAPLVTVQPSGAASLPVVWSSDNQRAVTVDAVSGVLTVVGPGSAHVTATATTGSAKLTAVTTVTATMPVVPTAIALSPAAPQTVMLVDAPPVLAVQFTPASPDVTTCAWVSSAPSVVSVSQQGLLALVGPGTATITASTTDGSNLTASTTVTVVVRVTGIAFGGGSSLTLKNINVPFMPQSVVISPSNASNPTLRWTSTAPEIASVDSLGGTITPIANGSATITARSTDGGSVSAALAVTVAGATGNDSNNNSHADKHSGPAAGTGAASSHVSTKVIIIIVASVVALGLLVAAFLVYRKKARATVVR